MGKIKYSATGVTDGLDRLTKQANAEAKIKKIVANFDVHPGMNGYSYLLNEGVAMRELGYTYKQIDKVLEQKLELIWAQVF